MTNGRLVSSLKLSIWRGRRFVAGPSSDGRSAAVRSRVRSRRTFTDRLRSRKCLICLRRFYRFRAGQYYGSYGCTMCAKLHTNKSRSATNLPKCTRSSIGAIEFRTASERLLNSVWRACIRVRNWTLKLDLHSLALCYRSIAIQFVIDYYWFRLSSEVHYQLVGWLLTARCRRRWAHCADTSDTTAQVYRWHSIDSVADVLSSRWLKFAFTLTPSE